MNAVPQKSTKVRSDRQGELSRIELQGGCGKEEKKTKKKNREMFRIIPDVCAVLFTRSLFFLGNAIRLTFGGTIVSWMNERVKKASDMLTS